MATISSWHYKNLTHQKVGNNFKRGENGVTFIIVNVETLFYSLSQFFRGEFHDSTHSGKCHCNDIPFSYVTSFLGAIWNFFSSILRVCVSKNQMVEPVFLCTWKKGNEKTVEKSMRQAMRNIYRNYSVITNSFLQDNSNL